jgi:hypothetical protein
MSETTSSEVIKEYQEALKAVDKDPSKSNQERLEKAKAARDALTKDMRKKADEKMISIKTTDEPKKESVLDGLKAEMKAARQKIVELRNQNKQLHADLVENIKLKKEYNYKIIPDIAKRMKEAKKKNGSPKTKA